MSFLKALHSGTLNHCSENKGLLGIWKVSIIQPSPSYSAFFSRLVVLVKRI